MTLSMNFSRQIKDTIYFIINPMMDPLPKLKINEISLELSKDEEKEEEKYTPKTQMWLRKRYELSTSNLISASREDESEEDEDDEEDEEDEDGDGDGDEVQRLKNNDRRSLPTLKEDSEIINTVNPSHNYEKTRSASTYTRGDPGHSKSSSVGSLFSLTSPKGSKKGIYSNKLLNLILILTIIILFVGNDKFDKKR